MTSFTYLISYMLYKEFLISIVGCLTVEGFWTLCGNIYECVYGCNWFHGNAGNEFWALLASIYD